MIWGDRRRSSRRRSWTSISFMSLRLLAGKWLDICGWCRWGAHHLISPPCGPGSKFKVRVRTFKIKFFQGHFCKCSFSTGEETGSLSSWRSWSNLIAVNRDENALSHQHTRRLTSHVTTAAPSLVQTALQGPPPNQQATPYHRSLTVSMSFQTCTRDFHQQAKVWLCIECLILLYA